MKKDLTYKDAFARLQVLVEELEDGRIDLEQLAAKTKQANELIEVCSKKLRAVERETGLESAKAGSAKK